MCWNSLFHALIMSREDISFNCSIIFYKHCKAGSSSGLHLLPSLSHPTHSREPLPNKDPYAHLASYIEICNTVKIAGVPESAICLNLFSFSLEKEAKRWLHSFKGNNLRTWELITQDATLAQNKLLSRQIEALNETLSKLPQQL